jgi:AraC-like DNA-binding protein
MPKPEILPEILINPDSYRASVPLDELLRSIRFSSLIKGTALFSAPWGYDSPAYKDTVVLYLIFEGSCYVRIPELNQSLHLAAGDALYIPKSRAHTVSDSETTTSVPLDKILSSYGNLPYGSDFLGNMFRRPLVYGGGGRNTHMEALRFFVNQLFPSALLNGLPPMVKLDGFARQHAGFLNATFLQMVEHGASGFTGQAIATRLGEAILVLFLREYFSTSTHFSAGIHKALRDPAIARAIGAMQQAPAENWSVAKLAAVSTMSRSAFVPRFTELVGQTPSHFLTTLRMLRATELLKTTRMPLSCIAVQSGYGSEAAFNRAFKRWCGVTPGSLRERQKDTADVPAGAIDPAASAQSG